MKNIICIECPKGCALTVDYDQERHIRVVGYKCKKGERYGVAEIQNPVRFLTSTVLAMNLPVKMIPVRTDRPIPKNRIFEAMGEIKKIQIKNSVSAGDIVAENFMGLGVNLIATRTVKKGA